MNFRILHILILAIFLPVAQLEAQNCLSASATGAGTICGNNCVNIGASIQGSKETTTYLISGSTWNPYPFTGGNPVIVNLDDVWSQPITLPFCFEFFGNTYNQLIIGTNGVVSFDLSQASGLCPWSITAAAPSSTLPLNSIMAPFHDINPTLPTDSGQTTINWQVHGTAPCSAFVINWFDVAQYGAGCDTLTSSSQVVLYESTNVIDINILSKPLCTFWNGGGAIEGLQDATASMAVIATGRNYPILWQVTQDTRRFIPGGAPQYTVQWFDPSGNLIGTNPTQQVCPTQTTTYTMIVTNTNCAGTQTFTDYVTLTVQPSNLTATSTTTPTTCDSACIATATAIPSGGVPPYTYTWTPPVSFGPNATNLCPGNYTCTIVDAAGCTVQVPFTILPPSTFTVQPTSTNTICNGNTGSAAVNVTGPGPFSYQWSTGDTTNAIYNLTQGSYVVVVSDTSGCTDTIGINISGIGLQATQQVVHPLCPGDCNGTATLTMTNGNTPYTFTWNPPVGNGPTATGLCAGTYACNVEDGNGCTATIAVILVNPTPMTIAPAANQTICFGQTTTVATVVTGGTPPYTYAWNNNLLPQSSNNVSPAQTTVYTCTVTDANGCTAENSVLVKVNPNPTAAFNASAGYCPPSTIYFNNFSDSAVSWIWYFGDPGSGTADSSTAFQPSHTYNSGGTYSVTLVAFNNYGCSDTFQLATGIVIPYGPTAGIQSGNSIITELDPTVLFTNTSTPSVQYEVYFGDGDSLITGSTGPYAHTYDTIGTYTVMIVAWDAQGCSDTAYLTIDIEELSTCYIPNAFTPNGDGVNDIFYVEGINLIEMQLMIFDRWGMLIFETRNQQTGWDGKFKGSDCQEDVYVWRLYYTLNDGSKHKAVGTVTLVR